MTSKNEKLNAWVQQMADLCQPDRVEWCDGSDAEWDRMMGLLVEAGAAVKLDESKRANSYRVLSDPADVARVEDRTFICCEKEIDAGPTNNWTAPAEMREKLKGLFGGCMKGRTLYVVPFSMGPLGSPIAHIGVQVTDSPYVVANMKIMTRMGAKVLDVLGAEGEFVPCVHSVGMPLLSGGAKIEDVAWPCNADNKYIVHFTEEREIWSFGSGYGGNALLGKKCHALRIASYQARTEGWLAEHMLIVGVESPQGETHYIACALPSACGKTNLAMLIPPESMPGWKIWTLGDDIAWLHLDDDGQLRAINPESGYFGVVPGTNEDTNENAFNMIRHDAIFTNVARTADNEPWWENKNVGEPAFDWQGRPYDPANGKAAHPNSRFTVASSNNPSYSELAEAPAGVPITAIVFGGRRKEVAPLVYQAKSWNHGVLVGAGVASETTSANIGEVGVVRRDPMAMKPFCGYNFADYWAHWLSFAERTEKLPDIFHVNWFRQDQDRKFLWPGFGENLRVLHWIIERCEGRIDAVETPIGFLPTIDGINTNGLEIDSDDLRALTSIDAAQWQAEIDAIGEYLESYGDRLPEALRTEQQRIAADLSAGSLEKAS